MESFLLAIHCNEDIDLIEDYEEREEMRHLDDFCSQIEVITNDGKKLYYGFSNHDKKN